MLSILAGGVDVISLVALGAVPGVAVLWASANNQPGVGRLRCGGNKRLCWRAPGSTLFGPAIDISAGGTFVLCDGGSADKLLRVQSFPAYLETGANEAQILLRDVYNNPLGGPDVTAAQAAAGDVQTFTFTLQVAGGAGITQLYAWIDGLRAPAENTELAISADGSTWVTPTTEASALLLAEIPVGGSIPFYVRRTITAAAASNAGITNYLHFSYTA